MQTFHRLLIFLLLSLTSALGSAKYTYSWWADGYPYTAHKHEERRPIRILQTSDYALALNTTNLTIPHFGPLSSKFGYQQAAYQRNADWAKLPSAALSLTIDIDGQLFTAVGGSIPKRPDFWHQGPRLIEAGRHWQRFDVWKLNFKGPEGQLTEKNARIEFGAWADRLTLKFTLDEKLGDGTISLKLDSGDKAWHSSAPLTTGKGETRLNLDLSKNSFNEIDRSKAPDTTLKTTAKHAFENEFQAHVIDISAVTPLPLPEGATKNDNLFSIPFTLKNTTNTPVNTPLVLNHPQGSHFLQHFGVPITGVSVVICDEQGRPTGIPVQLSKNWHATGKLTIPFQYQWFRGFTRIPLLPNEEKSYQVKFFHGHWGGLPAASHAQLCLIGWGMNQIWEQSALGAWGETFCYEPTRAHRDSFITDVRPLLVESYTSKKEWNWTHNMGGGDFFVFEKENQKRMNSSFVRSTYLSSGPCLTDTLYSGVIGDNEASFEIRTFLGRTDDLARTTYKIRFEALKDFKFERGVFFQIGADHYNDPIEGKIAYGNTSGNSYEWWTKDQENSEQMHELLGDTPWVSLHYVKRQKKYGNLGALASRGIIIRDWKSVFGGKPYNPFLHQRVTGSHDTLRSQAELVVPPSVETLKKGDYVEATIEFLIIPETKNAYYGENEDFRNEMGGVLNKWESVEQQARKHRQNVVMKEGTLLHLTPDIRVKTVKGKASFTVNGNQSQYTPVTFTNLNSPNEGSLKVAGKPLDQATYGNDFHQIDYDEVSNTWSKTYNVKFSGSERLTVDFQ